ncbi:amidohydrolase [Xinfangfangia sp. D13-10-4-6]|uniref:M20 metallopeptidase family protein n=1 Tax=Pseudogemmobacter hezensis TaxID=2737662 RepID=UPI001555AA2F|nr:amidohydrolase [Pseudogemmobacter hezensis]NPD16752.1 amidohydrolase [Pseudogemmobacter hezensis]
MTNDRISQIAQTAVGWRHHLHRCPEPGYAEHETADFIAQTLISFGLTPSRGLAGTGVVAEISGSHAGPVTALRCEMDALPIQEVADLPHASRNGGFMHACGHDGHMAMLLGLAQSLAEDRTFPGKVVLIFQPAEETGGGALRMIDEGLLQAHPFDRVFSIHNLPGEPAGAILTRSGPIMAAATVWDLTIRGKGSHAGWPHLGIDAISIAADFVQGCQAIVARRTDPVAGATLSPTRISGGNTYNTLPEEVHIGGTLRALDDGVSDAIIARMRALAAGLALSADCRLDFRVTPGYPVTVNHPSVLADVMRAARAVAGDNVSDSVSPKMGTEDFAYMLREKPGAYIFLGAGDIPALHANLYDFNDAILEPGIRLMAALIRTASMQDTDSLHPAA